MSSFQQVHKLTETLKGKEKEPRKEETKDEQVCVFQKSVKMLKIKESW